VAKDFKMDWCGVHYSTKFICSTRMLDGSGAK